MSTEMDRAVDELIAARDAYKAAVGAWRADPHSDALWAARIPAGERYSAAQGVASRLREAEKKAAADALDVIAEHAAYDTFDDHPDERIDL